MFSTEIATNGRPLINRARKALLGAAVLVTMVGFAASLAAQERKEITSPALAAQERKEITSLPLAEVKAREAWAKTMHHTPAHRQGCFQAAYPSTEWQEVKCAPPPGYRSARPRPFNRLTRRTEVGGTGGGSPLNNDIVVQAPSGHLFSSVVGSFPTVAGVSSESSVGVPAFGGGGILGANEYTLQVNTNATYSAACGSFSYCTAWQQYVMSTNTPVSLTSSSLTNETEVFIEYWLLNYGVDNGSNICPAGFVDAGADGIGPGDDCVQNGAAMVIYSGQIPITDLHGLTLSGSAITGGIDVATVTYGGHAYQATVADSFTDIASVWNQAEFNVVGNAGGSEAVFNNGTAITVQIAVTDGSPSAPTCAFNGGTTGESNNLNFVPSTSSPVCCPYGGSDPSIEFMEVYDTSHTHTASCGSSSIIGEPHITTVNDIYYNFQAAGEFIALLDPDGTEIQTRQTPLPSVAPGDYDPGHLNDDGLISCLAMNTAVAARVGTHRVTYQPNVSAAKGQIPFDLRIDGKVTKLGAQGVNLGGGAQVKNSVAGGGIEVDFPDGKIMTALPSTYAGLSLLNVQFENTGLLRDGDGATELGIAGAVPKGSWLPSMPSGASLGAMPATLHERYVTLYNTFGNAWRVTSKNTLFDYAPGTSTATFTNTQWPVENAKTCTIPNQPAVKPVSVAVAEEACKSVSDARLHAGCLFDVQVTGTAGFAKTYQASESAHRILNVKPIDFKLLVPQNKVPEARVPDARVPQAK